MNERMLKLYSAAQVPHTAIDPSNNMPYETTCFSTEKFAELIVKETMQVVANNLPPNTYLDVADAVIKHFEEK